MTSTPVCHVENHEFRRVCKHEIEVVRKTVTDVIFKLTELVDRRIVKVLCSTTGAIVYDGWSENSVHYVAIYASYCVDVLGRSDNRDTVRKISRVTLLGILLLASAVVDDDGEENEAATFDAEAHIRYFKETMSFYGLDLETWTRGFIADNCAVNLRIARNCGKPHAGCVSHKLNLEVNEMLTNHVDLDCTISSVLDTTKSAKQKLRNEVIFQNITSFRPLLHNATRWPGKYCMLRQFVAMHADLLEASEQGGTNLSF